MTGPGEALPEHELTPPEERAEHECGENDCPDCGRCLECHEHRQWCGAQTTHFSRDAEGIDVLEDGPPGPHCPCSRCGAKFPEGR